MNLCQETSGFLFSHRCGRPSFMTCLTCLKPICAQHARPAIPEGFRCIACALVTGNPNDSHVDHDGDEDPYFYRNEHAGAAPDAMDFTDGDRTAITTEGGTWEDDAGGS